tara:strand:- start:2040 stop:2219 length:180 start_codon:yes stop_codon:yes gene_type:complete
MTKREQVEDNWIRALELTQGFKVNIKEYVKKYPNDQELGRAIRDHYLKIVENINKEENK